MDENKEQTANETTDQPLDQQTVPDGTGTAREPEIGDKPVHEASSAGGTSTLTSSETVAYHGSVSTASPSQTNGLSTAGLVCGIVGVVMACIPFVNFFLGSILGILAVVFGAVAKRRDGSGKAGLILGVITLAVTIIWAIILLVLAVIFSGIDSSTF